LLQLETVHDFCQQFFKQNLINQENVNVQTIWALLAITKNLLGAGKVSSARKYFEFILLDWKEMPEHIRLLQTILMQD